MLRSEVSFSVGGRHSSTDSNKASSGDLSPYDNNSPVLSERSLLAMQEDVAPGGSEKLYKGPEQYVRVGHLPSSKSRDSSPGPRLGKGNSTSDFDCMWPDVGALDLLSIPSPFHVSLIQWAFTEDLPNTDSESESPQTQLAGKQSQALTAPDIPSWLFCSSIRGTVCVLACGFGCIFVRLRCHRTIAVNFYKENKLNLLYNKLACSKEVSMGDDVFRQNKVSMVKYIWEILG